MHPDLVEALALSFLNSFGLAAKGWTYGTNDRLGLGVCRFHTKVIEVSSGHMQHGTRLEIVDTILHEIAHALCYDKGLPLGHGPEWKAICVAIGARPERLGPASENKTPYKWRAVCPNCKHYAGYYRFPRLQPYCKGCCTLFANGVADERYRMKLRKVPKGENFID